MKMLGRYSTNEIRWAISRKTESIPSLKVLLRADQLFMYPDRTILVRTALINRSTTSILIVLFMNATPTNTPSPSNLFPLFVTTHYPMFSLLSLFLLSLILGDPDPGEFTYSEYPFLSIATFSTSVLLATKKSNLYWIDELSNVCVKDFNATAFGLSPSDTNVLSEHSGYFVSFRITCRSLLVCRFHFLQSLREGCDQGEEPPYRPSSSDSLE